MLDPAQLESVFNQAHTYDDYVKTGKDHQQATWKEVYDKAEPTDAQRSLISAFTRHTRILVSSGVWCGDCVQQCPLIARLAECSDNVHLRFIDRDDHTDLTNKLTVNGGTRVPVAVFMAEDFVPVSVFGDRTLNRYRALAAKQLGASCPVPGAPIDHDELHATMQDWCNELERVHLLLRLSTRLRQKHND